MHLIRGLITTICGSEERGSQRDQQMKGLIIQDQAHVWPPFDLARLESVEK